MIPIRPFWPPEALKRGNRTAHRAPAPAALLKFGYMVAT